MRHMVDGRKLGRTTAHRKAMFANMASSLVLGERIETTLPRAKELRRIADRLITLGKRQTLEARRRAVMLIRNKEAVHRLFSTLAGRFEGRSGGYTRILKLGWRHGDAAPMAAIEYLPSQHGHDSAPATQFAEERKHKEEKKAVKVERHAAHEPLKTAHVKAPVRWAHATKKFFTRARKAPTGE